MKSNKVWHYSYADKSVLIYKVWKNSIKRGKSSNYRGMLVWLWILESCSSASQTFHVRPTSEPKRCQPPTPH